MSDTNVETRNAAPTDAATIALAADMRDLESDIAHVRKQMKATRATIVVVALLTVAIGVFSFVPRLLGSGPGGTGFTPPTGATGSAPAAQTTGAGQ